MRKDIKKIFGTRHHTDCKFSVDNESRIIYSCHPDCAVMALGTGNSTLGVMKWIDAAGAVWRKQDNRRRRMKRKKRRGWA